jgi:hypothetical protein
MGDGRYQRNSARKCLIHKEFEVCFFSGHRKQTLDLQGFGTGGA